MNAIDLHGFHDELSTGGHAYKMSTDLAFAKSDIGYRR